MVQQYLRKIVKWNNKDLEIIFYKGQFWFKAKGVADILEYENTRDAIRTHVAEKNKKRFIEFLPSCFPTVEKKKEELNVEERTVYINEAGFYTLIFKSHQPRALEFQEWVTGKVLPALPCRSR